MIGKLNPQDRRVTVIGAGFSGLIAAYALDQRGFEVTLLEKESRAGGLIRTQFVGEGMVEAAAHSMLVTPEIREICADLGVELLPLRERGRFIYRKGKARRIPLSFCHWVATTFRMLYVLSSDQSRGRATLEAWGRRHIGAAAVRYLLSPFVTGVFAARPSELAVGAAFPGLEVSPGHSFLSQMLSRFRAANREKSQLRPKSPPMMAPRDGMGAWITALEQRLERQLGERFRKGVEVSRLPEGVTNIILAVPAPQAAKLLDGSDPKLAEALRQIRYAPLISATVFAKKADFHRPPRGVGVLIPECEKRRILGVLFDSSSFENRSRDGVVDCALTVMLGGTLHPEYLDLSDEEIYEIIRAELVNVLGLRPGAQLKIHLNRWPRAIPLYDSTLMDVWEAARQGWCSEPGHVIFGNYSGEVSLRGMVRSVVQAFPESAIVRSCRK